MSIDVGEWYFVITHCCTLQASHIKRALRRLRPDFSLICLASSGGRSRPSFLHTDVRTLQTWHKRKNRDTERKVKMLSWSKMPKYLKFYFQMITHYSLNKYYSPSCLFCARQRNSDGQTTAPNRPNDFRGGCGTQNETAGGHVLFHCPAQSMLGILCESVHLC